MNSLRSSGADLGYKLIKSGKVREVYESFEEDHIILWATDRISAFDKNLPLEVPGKGAVLSRISAYWNDLIVNDLGSKTAYLGSEEEVGGDFALVQQSKDDPYAAYRCTYQDKVTMIPAEFIVRGYATGSLMDKVRKGEKTLSGFDIPDGLVEAARLQKPMFGITTKAETGHDEEIDMDDLSTILWQMGVMEPEYIAEKIMEEALLIYSYAEGIAKDKGLILVDTKFEFGFNDRGDLVLADEILTPDSSRYWPLEGWEPGKPQPSFDKQIARDFANANPDLEEWPPEVIEQIQNRYNELLFILTGKQLDI